MKIIRRGIPPMEREYRVECPGCKTVFEFKRNEATINREPRNGDFIDIDCPVCRNQVTVDANEFLIRARKKHKELVK